MPRRNPKIIVRPWQEGDLPALVECHSAVYSDYRSESMYDERIFRMQWNAFPEGQVLAELDGRIVGYATSLIVQLEDDKRLYTYDELTGSGTFSTHNPGGDTLYGADIGVIPEFRGKRIAEQLYRYRRRLLTRYNLRRLVAYGRIPDYREHVGRMTADEYVERVVAGELKDRALNAHLRAGYKVKRTMLNLSPDAPSADFSTWIEMTNPRYNAARRKIAAAPLRRPVRTIRVCAAQYMMRPLSSWDDFERCVDFFVDVADSYHCHYLVFPELFTVNLFSLFSPDMDAMTAVHKLAGMENRYLDMMRQRAQKFGMYIIGGSHPRIVGTELRNTAHLFTPSGTTYYQDKLHITPAERTWWDMQPGDQINIFETPHCRMAIQICYDIEFPEVSRLLALSGVDVIFVPYSTDDRKAYHRVRYSSQARAVENYIYVVMAGNVGNLPQVRSYLINHGQAAVLTPSDIGFPMNAVLAEIEPNQEAALFADLDLAALQSNRELASVRPLYDRRLDLYNLELRRPIRLIRVE